MKTTATTLMITAFLSITLAACTNEAPALDGRAADEIVKERAQARWDALIAGDYERAYEYSTPGYRSANSAAMFTARHSGGAIERLAANVEDVKCNDDDRCQVTVMLTYQAMRPRLENTRPLEETWIMIDNQWWIFIR